MFSVPDWRDGLYVSPLLGIHDNLIRKTLMLLFLSPHHARLTGGIKATMMMTDWLYV